ncbi:hypothetical protein C772_01817 [Bhargavaea cecembensis DSE10]|uniref:Topology modulation protein n=1 Tax=Bhargavaea cecembensis DSE10 TaxID=1235279 RepID=M7NG07_9BACL|nr:hypothetical protein [Bhargavaea cecembensis]EMR06172.1 hypothetical protein C772_01817 [Bhargavaea cecembensis DSE10]
MAYKIQIIGAVGSGKTTMARGLAEKLGIPHYEIDNVAWERRPGGDVRRSPEALDKLLASIVSGEAWITEGTHPHDWVRPCFREAELIVFLDPPYRVRTMRIIRRFARQKIGIDAAHYRPTWTIFRKMFKWNHTFERRDKPELLVHFRKVYPGKLIVIRRAEELNL